MIFVLISLREMRFLSRSKVTTREIGKAFFGRS